MPDFNMPTEKFITLTGNILQSAFLGKNKAESKKNFKKLVAGKKMPAGKLGIKDSKTSVDLFFTLNDEAFSGVLTYHLFSQVLTSMLQAIARQLQAKKEIRMFTNTQTGDAIFFVPGFVEEDGRQNMLVLSLRQKPGKATIELLFLDPEQFRQAVKSESSETGNPEVVEAVADEGNAEVPGDAELSSNEE